MPFGDGTGPAGLGPMTGRAAGYCAGYGVPGYANPIPGRGFGLGYGRGFGRGGGRGGRGWRNQYYATGLPGWARAGVYPTAPAYVPAAAPGYVPVAGQPPADQELTLLKGQAQSLQTAMENIQKRINELEKATETQEA